MAPQGVPEPADPEPVPPGVRAQILATEHWSLLATRSQTWSEVMSRISIHLTVASASLVVLALVTQATGFGTGFQVLAIGLTSAVLVLGTLTLVRVHNASEDDAMLVLGMNRLRAAYLALDPSVADHLVTSAHDDRAGVRQTYTMGTERHLVSHVLGSTSMFMTIVNSMVAGTLAALIADVAHAGPALVAVLGVLVGLAYLGGAVGLANRSFNRSPVEPRFPSTPPA
jgi:hypothetical protein